MIYQSIEMKYLKSIIALFKNGEITQQFLNEKLNMYIVNNIIFYSIR